jgi:hypothetical protein
MAKPPTPPKSLEWYLDGVKWLIIISAGAIAFGLATLEKTAAAPVYGLFAGYAALLSITSTCGMLYLFNFYYYVSLRETGKPNDDAEVTTYKTRADRAYTAVAWSFGLGMAAFAAFAGAYVWDLYEHKQADTPEHHALGGNGPDLAIYQKGDKLWVLQRQPNGALVWRAAKLPH